MKNMCALRDQAINSDDSAGVHDMRVASRRLRSALSDFKPYLRKGSMPLARLKAIARSLGDVRDADVALTALADLGEKAGGEVALGIQAIIEEQRRRRMHACASLERMLKSSAISEFREDFAKRLRASTSISHALTFSQLGAQIIGVRLKEMIDAGAAVYHPRQTKKLHKLRILAKRLRYALDLFAPCWGDEFKKTAHEIAKLQTSLGELHDCDVWIADLGARLEKKDNGVSDRRQQDAVSVWLLQHFVNERATHYGDALARWHNWESEAFLASLGAILDADSKRSFEVVQDQIRTKRAKPRA